MKLDQHFLIDEKIIKRIVSEAKIKESDSVLEIGPGTGNITKFFPKCNLILIEKDEELANKLKSRFGDVKIIVGNALDFIDKLKFDLIVSALPYSISEPLMRKLVLTDFKRAILVMPKNLIDSTKKNNTSLGIVSNAFLDFKIVDFVSKDSFDPPPDTNSYIVKITKKKKVTKKEKIVKEIYLQHDKKLKNALREYLIKNKKMTKRQAKEKIKKMNLGEKALNRNVKNITAEEWTTLLDFLITIE